MYSPCTDDGSVHRSVLFLSGHCTAYLNRIFITYPPMSLPLQMAALPRQVLLKDIYIFMWT